MAYEDTPNDATNLGASYFSKTSDSGGSPSVGGLTASTTYVIIPTSVLDGLHNDEAAHASGSYRAIVRSIVDALYTIENAKASSAKSTKMTISRSGLSAVSGSASEVQRTISFTFNLDASGLEVASESIT